MTLSINRKDAKTYAKGVKGFSLRSLCHFSAFSAFSKLIDNQ